MTFLLKIVTPEGFHFHGQAEKLIIRTVTGDMAVLSRHMNCVCPLGMGRATVESEGQRRTAACMGGLICIMDGEVTLIPTTFEWADQIDADRAERSLRRAEEILGRSDDPQERRRASARRDRALVRKSVAGGA